jgi:hypothetical protein
MYGTGISQEVGNGGQVCGDVEAVDFPLQNVYKMAYEDENTSFAPPERLLIHFGLLSPRFHRSGSMAQKTTTKSFLLSIGCRNSKTSG